MPVPHSHGVLPDVCKVYGQARKMGGLDRFVQENLRCLTT